MLSSLGNAILVGSLVVLACDMGPGQTKPHGTAEKQKEKVGRVTKEELSAATRGEGTEPLETLSGAVGGSDEAIAHRAAFALRNSAGCRVVEGGLKKDLAELVRRSPSPDAALLLSCIRGDDGVLRTLRDLPAEGDLHGFSPIFSVYGNWKLVRALALAEAGDQSAKTQLLSLLRDGERRARVFLLQSGVFEYVRDRELLLELGSAVFDSRPVFEGEVADDVVNPAISTLAIQQFGERLSEGRRGAAAKNESAVGHAEAVLQALRAELEEIEEGGRTEQPRLPGEGSRKEGG